MKKLLLNIIMGIIISIATLGVVTLLLGAIYTNNGFVDVLVEELFTNVEIKVLLISLVGIIAGIVTYLDDKYVKNKKFLANIASSILLVGIIFELLSLTNYTILFKVIYLTIFGLLVCILVTINDLGIRKNNCKN